MGAPGARGRGDAALVEAVVAGDQAAFAELFDRYGPAIHGFCTRVLGDPHTAADATQDTFVAASQRLGGLRDPDKLRPWLYAVARNECTRHGRARDRAVPSGDAEMIGRTNPDPSAGGDEVSAAVEADEMGALVWAAADGLDDRDRVLLELQLRHGLEGTELALAAGVAPGQISMATGRLRDRLERAIGALLVARGGNLDCPELGGILAGWDGTFSVLVRKRVARHLDRCDRCGQRRTALVAPLGRLALVPAMAVFALDDLPAGLRDRTLDAAAGGAGAIGRAAPGGGTDGPWSADGFPPSPEPDTDDEVEGAEPSGAAARRRVLAVVAALVAAGLVLGALVVGRDDATTAETGSGPTTTAVAGPGTDLDPTTTDEEPSPSTTMSVPATAPSDVAATTVPGDLATDDGDPAAPPASTAPPVAVPAPTPAPTTTTTAPPANQAPTVGATTRSGSASMQTTCNPANDRRTITVTVTDDGAVASVVLRWDHDAAGSGQRAMARSGTTWSAALGPFADPGTVTYRAVATDDAGRSGASPTAVVTVDPCPG